MTFDHEPTLTVNLTLSYDYRYKATCDCGWVGPWTLNKHTSVAQHNHHVAAYTLAFQKEPTT